MLKIFLENFTTNEPNKFLVAYIPEVGNAQLGDGKIGIIELPPDYLWTTAIGLSVLNILKKVRQSMTIYTNDPNIIRIMTGDDPNEKMQMVRQAIEEFLTDTKLEIKIEQRGQRYDWQLNHLVKEWLRKRKQ